MGDDVTAGSIPSGTRFVHPLTGERCVAMYVVSITGNREHCKLRYLDGRGYQREVRLLRTEQLGKWALVTPSIVTSARQRRSETKRLSIVRDEDCPECGFPETYAEGPETSGPDVIGCRKCGWQQSIAAV